MDKTKKLQVKIRTRYSHIGVGNSIDKFRQRKHTFKLKIKQVKTFETF